MRLGHFILSGDQEWETTKQRAAGENAWFIPEFVNLSAATIARQLLAEDKLQALLEKYNIPQNNHAPKKVGIVMAGNIPMVGFHDLLCCFLTGHFAWIKLSSKDTVLIKFLVQKMIAWQADAAPYFTFAEMLKGCDAYIATGSNNSSHYFSYYFSKYPHIIRKNRTSVAILSGEESKEELEKLADDVYQYFGLGCRNVTQIYVPEGYQFEPLLQAFGKYNYLADHHKFKNNYDYNLAIHLLNKRYFMSNESLLLVEDASPFSPIGQLHYQFYTEKETLRRALQQRNDIQCVVSREEINFGEAQCPGITDFADGVDTLRFLLDV